MLESHLSLPFEDGALHGGLMGDGEGCAHTVDALGPLDKRTRFVTPGMHLSDRGSCPGRNGPQFSAVHPDIGSWDCSPTLSKNCFPCWKGLVKKAS